jgi:deoxyribose-phosphate aldolase
MTHSPQHSHADIHAIAALIDHTILKPETTQAQVERVCQEALTNKFASVCINPIFVPVAAALLHDSPVKVCTVVGFPLGANHTSIKVAEAQRAIGEGAQEIDMVIHIGGLKCCTDDQVWADIQAVTEACHSAQALCKVIIETCLLNEEEKVRACRLAATANADFVKTSTGFSTAGATAEDVALMRTVVGPHIGVKASGGIRTLAQLQAMVAAGATRIGTSSGPQILAELHP